MNARSLAAAESRQETFERLLALAWASRFENPAAGLAYAHRAALIADAATAIAPRQASEFRARAHGHVGNLLRISGNYTEAARKLDIATKHLAAAGWPAPTGATLASFRGSLAFDRQDFDLAIVESSRASKLYLRAGDCENSGRCRHQVGAALRWAGFPLRAASAHERALEVVSEPSSVGAALNGLGLALTDAGRLAEAGNALGALQARPEILEFLGSTGRARALWAWGRLAAAQGSASGARECIGRARDDLAERSLWIPAALASVDLAAAETLGGRALAAYRTCIEADDLIRLAGFDREGLALRIIRETAAEQLSGFSLLAAVSRGAALTFREAAT